MHKGFHSEARNCRVAHGLITALVCIALAAGCATPSLDRARYLYYAGRWPEAAETAEKAWVPPVDRVLLHMERGMIKQASGQYEESTRDFLAASDLLEQLEVYSLSKGAASFVVNDGTQDFRGTPYERTLLHVFTALNHLMMTNAEHAAVEGRRIVKSLEPERRGTYPEDAFSRYVAGLAFELIGDKENAGVQYRLANKLVSGVLVNPQTGHLLPSNNFRIDEESGSVPGDNAWGSELVCVVLLGRAPSGRETWEGHWQPSVAPYAEIIVGNQSVGRSYVLADVAYLAYQTEQIQAAWKAAKTAVRIVTKEALASAIERETDNPLLGALARVVLIGMLEQPDIRRWETLPRWLQVARVPFGSLAGPPEIVIRGSTGHQIASVRPPEIVRVAPHVWITLVRHLWVY